MHMHMYTHMCTHTCAHTHTHTPHARAHTHTHTHTMYHDCNARHQRTNYVSVQAAHFQITPAYVTIVIKIQMKWIKCLRRVNTHTQAHTNTHKHTQAHTSTHKHTQTHTHTHTHTHNPVRLKVRTISSMRRCSYQVPSASNCDLYSLQVCTKTIAKEKRRSASKLSNEALDSLNILKTELFSHSSYDMYTNTTAYSHGFSCITCEKQPLSLIISLPCKFLKTTPKQGGKLIFEITLGFIHAFLRETFTISLGIDLY